MSAMIVEIDAKEAIALLSCTQHMGIEHINWMNSQEGFPLMESANNGFTKANAAGAYAYQYIRLERIAKAKGWIPQ